MVILGPDLDPVKSGIITHTELAKKYVLGCVIPPVGAVARSRNLQDKLFGPTLYRCFMIPPLDPDPELDFQPFGDSGSGFRSSKMVNRTTYNTSSKSSVTPKTLD